MNPFQLLFAAFGSSSQKPSSARERPILGRVSPFVRPRVVYFSVVVALGLNTIQGQTLFAPNGTMGTSGNSNVGIGEASPAQKLTIKAGHEDTQLRLFSDAWGEGLHGEHTALLSLWASEPGWTWGGVGIGNNVTNSYGITRITNTRGGSYMRFLNDIIYLNVVTNTGTDYNGITIRAPGNVGIGTIDPSGKLEIAGGAGSTGVQSYFSVQAGYSAPSPGNAAFSGGTKLVLWNDITTPQRLSVGMDDNADMWFANLGSQAGAGYTFYTSATGSESPTPRFKILKNGNVGIGTTNPTHKLAVNGTIKAKEIIVETTGWSDYVFADDYTLASLAEVEAHIKEHKHLPGIPSATQVADQGISVGDMQARLLAKIEELTLHVIELKKDNDVLHRRVESLEHK
jgi:hypothetical protein